MHPNPASRIFIAGFLVIVTGFTAVYSGFSLTAGGNTGVYLLPAEVHGFIDGSVSTNSRYVWSESSTSQYGYVEQTYKYKHPFPEKTLPNAGFNLGLLYTTSSRLGFFIEGCRTFSVLDKEINQSVPDTLQGDAYSIVPHDYRIRIAVSNDKLHLKSFQLGIGLSYTVPLQKGGRFIIAGSFGTVNYTQYFHVETQSITNDYYQSNGNRVYSDTSSRGAFEVFGIRYEAACFKPAITYEWNLPHSPLSGQIGLACPVALIEKGVQFRESTYYNDYETVYYPSDRFWTGNVILSAGIRYYFNKGDKK